MKKLIIIVLFMFFNVFGVEIKQIFCSLYGEDVGRFKKANFDYPDEMGNLPRSIMFKNNKLYVADCHNRRTQIISLAKKEAIIIAKDGREYVGWNTSCTEILFIDNHNNIIHADGSCYCVKDEKWFKIEGIKSINVFINYRSNLKIIQDEFKIRFFDSTYVEVSQDSLKEIVEQIENDVLYLKKERAFVSKKFNKIKKYVRDSYNKIVYPDTIKEVPPLFRFPDTTELKPYLSKRPDWAEFLGIDDKFNTYWYLVTQEYVNKRINPDERVLAIFKFDKLGKLESWFPEPRPEGGWKNGARIVVNEEGRIFRMHYHDTEGIRIVEYLYREDTSK